MGAGTLTIMCRPLTYKNRIRRVSSSVKEIIVSELQAEPWGPRPVTELTRSEEAITMSPELLRRNVRIASGAGFRTALFWGVEWYWLRTRGDPRCGKQRGRSSKNIADLNLWSLPQ